MATKRVVEGCLLCLVHELEALSSYTLNSKIHHGLSLTSPTSPCNRNCLCSSGLSVPVCISSMIVVMTRSGLVGFRVECLVPEVFNGDAQP